tara:strand:+ start:458 stop:835 length:378 start_codon:yes stop_codon:yes gene_type:complete
MAFNNPNVLLKVRSNTKYFNTINPPKNAQVLYATKEYDIPVLYEESPFATCLIKLFDGKKIWFRINMNNKLGHLKALINKHFPDYNNNEYDICSNYPKEPLNNMDMTILEADISAKQLSLKEIKN